MQKEVFLTPKGSQFMRFYESLSLNENEKKRVRRDKS